jgi:DNA-binding NarL/FixJ family response regulator
VVRIVDDRSESARSIASRLTGDDRLSITADSLDGRPWRPPGSGLADVVVVEVHTLLRRPPGFFGGDAAPGGLPRLLALTSDTELAIQRACLAAGALGCCQIDCSPSELRAAVKQLHDGEPLLAPALLHGRRPRTAPRSGDAPARMLTARELEVLRLVASGKSAERVAATLSVSPLTVRAHLKSARTKLGVGSTLEALIAAIRARLIDPFA